MTLRRTRQIVASIRDRKFIESKFKLNDLRLLCTFISATIDMDPDARSSLITQAQNLGGPPEDEIQSRDRTTPGTAERFVSDPLWGAGNAPGEVIPEYPASSGLTPEEIAELL